MVPTSDQWRKLFSEIKKATDIPAVMNVAGENGDMFGLGGALIDIVGKDLNELPMKTMFCQGYNLTNAPYADGWYVMQFYYRPGFILQVAISAYDNDQIYLRRMSNETWHDWRRILTNSITLNMLYPVGSIYMSYTLDTPEKVGLSIGGTWVRTSEGKMPIGYSSSDSDFNGLKDGGSKTVALTVEQMPVHHHQESIGTGSGPYSYNVGQLYIGVGTNTSTANAGGGQAHNNMSPYAVRYMYRRTA